LHLTSFHSAGEAESAFSASRLFRSPTCRCPTRSVHTRSHEMMGVFQHRNLDRRENGRKTQSHLPGLLLLCIPRFRRASARMASLFCGAIGSSPQTKRTPVTGFTQHSPARAFISANSRSTSASMRVFDLVTILASPCRLAAIVPLPPSGGFRRIKR
jgi:hypothetical protein